jgi:cytidylate kinase
MKRLKIAIDGTAGSGKTTTAMRLAEKLGYKPVETGAIFRAITYYVLEQRIGLEDKEKLKKLLEKIKITQIYEKGRIRTFLNDIDVTEKLKDRIVEQNVSKISEIKEVRSKILEIEKELAGDGGVVMEGRDIGTVVLPDADVKIFLDAIRAKRRIKDFKRKRIGIKEDELIKEIEKRDRMDSKRDVAPLKIAEDAIYIDTTELTVEEQVERVYRIILKKMENEA